MTQSDRLELLRTKCAETSQAAVARALGYKPSTICQVLNGTYQGSADKVLTRVEEVYGGTTVNCPVVMGDITLGKCAEHRKRPFASTNPLRLLFHRTCPKCGGKP